MKIFVIIYSCNDNPDEPWTDNVIAFIDREKAEEFKKELEIKSKELFDKIKVLRDALNKITNQMNIEWVTKCKSGELRTKGAANYSKTYLEHFKELGNYNIKFQEEKNILEMEWQKENNIEYYIDYRETYPDEYIIEELEVGDSR